MVKARRRVAQPLPVPEATPRRVPVSAVVAGTVRPGLVYGSLLTLAGSTSAVLLVRNAERIEGPPLVVAFPVICLSVGGWFLLPALRTAVSRWRLYRYGVATTGRVTGRQATGVQLENRRVIETTYEFEGPDGPVEGTVSHLSAPPRRERGDGPLRPRAAGEEPARPSRGLRTPRPASDATCRGERARSLVSTTP